MFFFQFVLMLILDQVRLQEPRRFKKVVIIDPRRSNKYKKFPTSFLYFKNKGVGEGFSGLQTTYGIALKTVGVKILFV